MGTLRTDIDSAVASGVWYFASGSNHPGEIVGFAKVGIDVGVAAPDLHSAGVSAIVEAAMVYGARVFVDSGAFSEVGFGPTGPFVAEPISDEEWTKRLALYVTLAEKIGSKLYAVAPDQVAFQAETLARMARYAPEMQKVAALGANVLVPCQKGAMALVDFWAAAKAALGCPESSLVAAVPMKKDATSTADFAEFLAAAKPARVHLLGLGPKSDRFAEVVAAAKAASPSTELFCDSVLITSLVGRTNGRGGAPRPLTAMADEVQKEIEESLYRDCGDLDYTDSVSAPSAWMTAAGLRKLGKDLGLSGRSLTAFMADPDGWLQDDDRYLDPMVEMTLDAAWAEYAAGGGNTTFRKRETIERLFGSEDEAVVTTDTLASYRDAGDALVSMEQAGCPRSRAVARTHLDRSVSELEAAGSPWAAYFRNTADKVEADRQHAEQLDLECKAARAAGGIDAEISVLVARLQRSECALTDASDRL
jgi:hypothetical protein